MAGASFYVTGGREFADLSRDLRQAGRKDLSLELRKGLNRAVKPMRQAAKDGAQDALPKGGGLAGTVAGVKIRVKTRGGRNPSIKLRGTLNNKTGGEMDLNALDRGRLRHPVYGNRRVWVLQRVPDGWWSKALEDAAPEARKDIERAVDEVRQKLERG